MDQIGAVAVGLPEKLAGEASRLSRLAALARPAKRDAGGLPVRRDPEVDGLKHRLVVWTEHGCLPELARGLTAGERSALEARRAALALALEPFDDREEADRPRVEAAIGALLGGFVRHAASDERVAATVEVCRGALRKFPAWAVEEACLRLADPEATPDVSMEWAPSDRRVAKEAAEVVKAYRGALNDAAVLLEADAARAKALPAPAVPPA